MSEQEYKEALGRAKRALEDGTLSPHTIALLKDIFPELRMSEDEKIRKELLEIFKENKGPIYISLTPQKKNFLIYLLEKQGEQNPIINVPPREVILAIWDLGNEWKELTNGSISTEYGTQLDYIQKHWHESEYYLQEKQGEQNDSDVKVEPKFKVGDWIVNNDDDSVGQITKIIEGEDGFAYEHTNGYFHGIFEKDFHLWTIQDAKDGDFLACPLPKGGGEQVFIFKEIGKREYIDDCIEYYCRVCQGVFYESNMGFMGTASDKFKTATLKQRNLLIRKMREAGYEWSPDAKVLKKIKRKSQRMVSAETKEALLNESEREALRTEYEKGRADAIAEMQKKWSEEDEEMCQETIGWFEKKCFPFALENDNPARESIKWLKSLKDRYTWKPSKEQMLALKNAEGIVGCLTIIGEQLKSLYEDLKKL